MEEVREEQLVSAISQSGIKLREKRAKRVRLSTKKSDVVGEFIREHLGEKEFIFVYPSDTGCRIPIIGIDPKYTHLVGGCMRRKYLERMNVPISDEEDVSYLRRKQIGNKVEEAERENISEAGVLKHHNKKFVYIPDPNSNFVISGEIDMIVQIDGNEAIPNITDLFNRVTQNETECVIEVKSFYGYEAKKGIFGNRSVVGAPKYEHVLQTAQYIMACMAANGNAQGYTMFMKEENGKLVRDELTPKATAGVIYYIDRGQCDTAEHIISLDQQFNITMNGINLTQHGLDFHKVFDNYRSLFGCLKNQELPDRTSSYMYPEEQVLAMNEAGQVSKTRWDKYSRKQLAIGDWQCKYCGHAKFCIGDTPYRPETIPDESFLKDQVGLVVRQLRNEEASWQPTLIPSILTGE